MTEVAAPSAPSTPTTPNGGADPQPGSAAAPNPGSEQSANAQRIELAKLPPNTIVTVIADGEEREMTAADAFKFLGRGFSANKRFEDAKAERMTAAQERAEAQRMIEEIAGAVGDPARFRRILAENGITPAQWAQALLQADEQESRLTPEQQLRFVEAQRLGFIEAQQLAIGIDAAVLVGLVERVRPFDQHLVVEGVEPLWLVQRDGRDLAVTLPLEVLRLEVREVDPGGVEAKRSCRHAENPCLMS